MVGQRKPSSTRYELSNHLGNVLTTITDRKVGQPTPLDPSILDYYYYAEATSARDYYAFGQEITSRSYNHPDLGTNSYRYGFNAKERDENGEFGSLTHFELCEIPLFSAGMMEPVPLNNGSFRIYNPAIGKFMSVDPLADQFPG